MIAMREKRDSGSVELLPFTIEAQFRPSSQWKEASGGISRPLHSSLGILLRVVVSPSPSVFRRHQHTPFQFGAAVLRLLISYIVLFSSTGTPKPRRGSQSCPELHSLPNREDSVSIYTVVLLVYEY